MDLLDALDRAGVEFRSRLAEVGAADWVKPTPCHEWDVRYVVAHVVGGNRFASCVLAGASAQQAMESVMSTPQLGLQPLEDFDASSVSQRDAFRREGALARCCDHPVGELSGEQFLVMRVFDVTVYAWDLADALGVDDHLDDRLCTAVLAALRTLDDGLGFGIMPVGRATARDGAQTRLLDLAGRTR